MLVNMPWNSELGFPRLFSIFIAGKGSKQQQVSKEHDPAIKFFVSNLPERCSSSDLVRVLKVFAEVQVDLEEQLKDVWIGSYKLFIVPARFVDGVDVSKKKEVVWQPVSKNGSVGNNMHAEYDKEKRGINRVLVYSMEPDVGLMEIIVDPSVQAFSEWYDYAFVGRVIDFSTLTKLRRILKLISPYKIDVKYVGGFHVMLLFEWAEVFCQLQDWKGQDCQVERIISLKLHGVPVMLSNVLVFDTIAGRFWDVIQSTQFTKKNNTNISFAVCGVLCKSVERIQQTVALRWKDKVIR
ncbi:hypothetical protein Hanom_Chr11g01064601 [Helianthus anomalus]